MVLYYGIMFCRRNTLLGSDYMNNNENNINCLSKISISTGVKALQNKGLSKLRFYQIALKNDIFLIKNDKKR